MVPEAHATLSQHGAPAQASVSGAAAASINLLDWGDDAPAGPVVAAPVITAGRLHLKEAAVIPPAQFQQLWSALPDSFNGGICRLSSAPASGAELDTCLRAERVSLLAEDAVSAVRRPHQRPVTNCCPPQVTVIASGPLPASSGQAGLKLFICAAEEGDGLLAGDGPVYLGQLVVLTGGTREVSVVVKTDASPAHALQSAKRFVDCLLASLGRYGPAGI